MSWRNRIGMGIVMILSLGGLTYPAAASAMDENFAAAALAYDAGDYAAAIRAYQQIVRDGFISAELFYNKGNAWYRQGDIGQAVLNYKRAQYLRPRDADIRHNLAFVMQEAGAIRGELGWFSRFLRQVSLHEWIAIAVIFWWVTGVLVGVSLWRQKGKAWAWPIGISAAITLVAVAGMAVWMGLRARPELVIIQSGQDALFAPLEGSTPHFALPKGSTARVEARTEGWYRVRVGDRDGWIRERAVVRVSPWTSAGDGAISL